MTGVHVHAVSKATVSGAGNFYSGCQRGLAAVQGADGALQTHREALGDACNTLGEPNSFIMHHMAVE